MSENSEEKESSAAIAKPYMKAAKSFQKIGEYGMAIKSLEKGISKAPDSSTLYIGLGQLLVSVFQKEGKPKHLKGALICFKRAIRLDPQNYIAHLLSAQIYLKGRAVHKSREMVEAILENLPGDERATSLLKTIEKKEADRFVPENKAPEKEIETDTKVALEAESTGDTESELVISKSLEEEDSDDSGTWSFEDKVVISSSETEEEEEINQERLASKLTIFSRLEGLRAIFLLDGNGMAFKSLNKAKLDENKVPTMIFNLFNSSMNGMRRAGLGSFQKGTLVSPIGTIIVANAFYATLAVIVDNDANLSVIDTRIQRYLNEVTG